MSNLKNIARAIKIARVFARNDALFFIENKNVFLNFIIFSARKKSNLPYGARLVKSFTELGPVFIKFGQALSVRPDIVSEEIAQELASLQDKLPPFPSHIAKAIIEKDLGDKIENLFSSFDENPIAAASISQVHFAEDNLGNKLAVKILRPDVEKKFEEDINLMKFVAKLVEKNLPKFKRLKPIGVVKTFEESCFNELDLMLEGAAANELAANFENDKELKVPKIFWDKTSKNVLTLERVFGNRIDDIAAIENSGLSKEKVLEKSASIFMKQCLRDGFFHADMHPGNMLVTNTGDIAVFDFGIMGRIDIETRVFLAEMLSGFLSRDYMKVSEVHFDAGYIPKHQDKYAFAQACRAIGEPILDRPQKDISIARLLSQLLKITEQFEMETQPKLLLLQKTMLMAEGIARKLNPDVNFWEISRELIEEWGKENLGVKGQLKIKISRLKNSFEKFMGAVDNLDKCFTPDGINLSTKTIEQLKQKSNSFFQGIFWGALCGTITSSAVIYLLFKF